jgi:hypothetical protein
MELPATRANLVIADLTVIQLVLADPREFKVSV